MSHTKQGQSTEATNLSQILSSEARLNRIYRLFKTNFDVTEPSIILEPYLFLGNCISAHDTNRLKELGIRYILNVAIRDVELCPYYTSDIRTLTIDLRDDERENILRIFDQVFAFIDETKRNKSRILVHCSHGQSRSPAIVIAYLMRTYNVSLEQCLVHVIKARPCVLPNDGFLKQLILYDRFLVERRRQREAVAAVAAAATEKVASNTSTTEIPIQHKSPVVPQSTTPTTSIPPEYSINKTTNETRKSSVESVNANSIHVIPIQVPSEISRPKKIEQITIKKAPITEVSAIKETKINTKQLKEKIPVNDVVLRSSKSKNIEVTSSNHTAPAKKRLSTMVIDTIQRPPSHSSRSQSAHTDRRQSSYHSFHSPSISNPQWNVTTYYPTNYHKSNERKPTKYITEIYDKATNRYIPTKC